MSKMRTHNTNLTVSTGKQTPRVPKARKAASSKEELEARKRRLDAREWQLNKRAQQLEARERVMLAEMRAELRAFLDAALTSRWEDAERAKAMIDEVDRLMRRVPRSRG